ncbi:MAG: carbonic anhydrase family protein [Polyangiales bacterium]
MRFEGLVACLTMASVACAADGGDGTPVSPEVANGEVAPMHELTSMEENCPPSMSPQSPINFPPDVVAGDLPDLTLDYADSQVSIRNTGGTVQYNYDPGSSLRIGVMPYDLVQFHFHAHSEHTLDGWHAPLELHLVHRGQDGTLLVLGVMLVEGEHNAVLDDAAWGELPASPHTTIELSDRRFHVGELIPNGPTYRYTGSLTAPPCTADVSWVVFQRRMTLDARQLAAFTSLYKSNTRVTQPLDGRSVQFGE